MNRLLLCVGLPVALLAAGASTLVWAHRGGAAVEPTAALEAPLELAADDPLNWPAPAAAPPAIELADDAPLAQPVALLDETPLSASSDPSRASVAVPSVSATSSDAAPVVRTQDSPWDDAAVDADPFAGDAAVSHPAPAADASFDSPASEPLQLAAAPDNPSPYAAAPRRTASRNIRRAAPAQYQEPAPATGGDDTWPGAAAAAPDQFAPVEAPHQLPATDAAADFDAPRGRPLAARSESTEVVETGAPGPRDMDGPQTPSLTIEKTAPAEVQVGQEAAFQLKLRNVGAATAHEIEVRDQAPRGTELLGTSPRAEVEDGQLVWRVRSLGPGEEITLEMRFLPQVEGELGSVATVRFAAEASVRTVATRPQLALEVQAPSRVMKGEQVPLKIRVANVGSGAASGVVLEENVPAGLTHPAGETLEYEIGRLAPNESREVELTLTAAEAGQLLNAVRVRGEGQLEAHEEVAIEVLAPALQVAMTGPKRRYLEREATYTFSVTNPGTAPAKQVELVTYLPRGLKFVEANNYGEYDAEKRAVHWLLEELPANETGSVVLRALPVESGEQKVVVRGSASAGLTADLEEVVTVEGLAAILFELVDVEDPIEVGAETTFEIRVLNQGTKTASNVRLMALIPEQMKAVAAEGPTRHVVEGSRVVFDALPRLAAKADASFRVRVQGLAAGDARLRVQLMTDELRSPVTKEESTRIYSDE